MGSAQTRLPSCCRDTAPITRVRAVPGRRLFSRCRLILGKLNELVHVRRGGRPVRRLEPADKKFCT